MEYSSIKGIQKAVLYLSSKAMAKKGDERKGSKLNWYCLCRFLANIGFHI
jgi:hypothetical protein